MPTVLGEVRSGPDETTTGPRPVTPESSSSDTNFLEPDSGRNAINAGRCVDTNPRLAIIESSFYPIMPHRWQSSETARPSVYASAAFTGAFAIIASLEPCTGSRTPAVT